MWSGGDYFETTAASAEPGAPTWTTQAAVMPTRSRAAAAAPRRTARRPRDADRAYAHGAYSDDDDDDNDNDNEYDAYYDTYYDVVDDGAGVAAAASHALRPPPSLSPGVTVDDYQRSGDVADDCWSETSEGGTRYVVQRRPQQQRAPRAQRTRASATPRRQPPRAAPPPSRERAQRGGGGRATATHRMGALTLQPTHIAHSLTGESDEAATAVVAQDRSRFMALADQDVSREFLTTNREFTRGAGANRPSISAMLRAAGGGAGLGEGMFGGDRAALIGDARRGGGGRGGGGRGGHNTEQRGQLPWTVDARAEHASRRRGDAHAADFVERWAQRGGGGGGAAQAM